MSDHDPLCSYKEDDGGPLEWPLGWCDCDLIAKVRADEQDACLATYWAKVEAEYDAWRDKYRADLCAQLAALPYARGRDGSGGQVWRSDVLALLDGGQR